MEQQVIQKYVDKFKNKIFISINKKKNNFKKLYFKEHVKLNIFNSNQNSNEHLEIRNQFKLKLAVSSKQYGFVAFGYKNGMLILILLV